LVGDCALSAPVLVVCATDDAPDAVGVLRHVKPSRSRCGDRLGVLAAKALTGGRSRTTFDGKNPAVYKHST
jgi:hypothetical protein